MIYKLFQSMSSTGRSHDQNSSSITLLKTPPAGDSQKTFLLTLSSTPEHHSVASDTHSATHSHHDSKGKIMTTPTASSDHNNDDAAACDADDRPPKLPVRNESRSIGSVGGDRDYECIETITNAWRTRGIDDIKHTEQQQRFIGNHPSSADAELADFVWQRSQSQKDAASAALAGGNKRRSPPNPHHQLPHQTTVSVASMAHLHSPTSDQDYDRLQFFAPKSSSSAMNHSATHYSHSHSLNTSISNIGGDYKTIITVTPPGYKKQNSQPVTSNDYEVIGSGLTTTTTISTTAPGGQQQQQTKKPVDLQLTKSRLADDSFLGYGILRKSAGSTGLMEVASPTTTVPSTATMTTIAGVENCNNGQHRPYNEMSYAIVSKPKRV